MTIVAENELERRVVADPEWREGVAWGAPRPGHPEGTVSVHIEEVLANIDEIALDEADRERLRFVALVHDTLKYQVARGLPRVEENHHAAIARRFAERYTGDPELLEVIDRHDDAYNAWANGNRSDDWAAAEAQARELIEELGPSIGFYLRFFRADNRTGSKGQAPLEWFERLAGQGAG
jgi:hypothetical protein